MQYRKNKLGQDISLLGYGCMRFSKKGQSIDIDKAESELLLAIENGVNYFDTAYIYPGSEAALGTILERNSIREKINIATKLPQYTVRNPQDAEKIFTEELSRLKTDYIDYYLMHMMTDIESFNRLQSTGVMDWAKEKKEQGIIKQLGFSFHGNSDMFIKILNAYDWDFAQIQYNYLDEHTQAGRKGLNAAAEKNIPIIIMEPLRGGKLVSNLPAAANKAMEESGRDYSPAEWGLRWLFEQPAVTCVLSGMNSKEMVLENCRIASDTLPNSMTDSDHETIEKIKAAINQNTKAPCTGCAYCMPCPKGVDIPGTFSCYNHTSLGKSAARQEYWQTVALRKNPGLASQCIECGKCESHCPQKLPIRDLLKEADKVLMPWYFKVFAWASRKFLFRKYK